MGRQLKLVLLLLLSIALCQAAVTPSSSASKILQDADNELDTSEEEPLWSDLKKNIKTETPKVKETPIVVPTVEKSTPKPTVAKPTAAKPASIEKKSIPAAALSDEDTSAEDKEEPLWSEQKSGIKISTPKVKDEKKATTNKPVSDPSIPKLLPAQLKPDDDKSGTKSEDNYDYDNYDYDEDYNYDDSSTQESTKKLKEKLENKSVEMKPIKEVKKLSSKSAKQSDLENNNIDNNANNDDDDDYDPEDEDEDDDDDDDDATGEEEIVFSENVPCPRYCVCARNINSYLVATCSRFDPGTQKFGSDITDLIVTDIAPKYPIIMGPEFFLQMGLKHVSSIKIANCTVEYLHPAAFHGLDELYSVNLTNVGLAIINPDTFVKNKKLRMLTISGNDLSVMSSVHYFLKSSSIEELDLSNNNLMELNPTAFSELSNIVYINLSKNNIQKIPDNVFDTVETIEELDLSYNSLKTLPTNIFNRTALAILHLKFNSITGNLSFGNSDLQQLDLSFNSINQVHHGMFDKMTGLTNLNLKGNSITKIQPDSFLTLKNLRHIDLSINELDQVSSMLFYKNSELDVIRLNDNPRLSQLPTDGFQSNNGVFTVYFLDISNCAIGALGHKTFSTMPHLATLKLAWNNINNLERDTFASLTKLIDLDLSNNLITKLDELTFMNNNELTKLNLAGNPIRKLSVRLFLPMRKLRDLDVSDCELNSLLTDTQYGVGRKYKFYETLRSFNASANQIKKVSSADVKNFRNLRTLDISHNPLKCSEDFQDFVEYASLKHNLAPKRMPMLANLESDSAFGQLQTNAGWAELAHEVCKHQEIQSGKGKTLEKRLEEVDKNLEEDAKKLLHTEILKDAINSEIGNKDKDMSNNASKEAVNDNDEDEEDEDDDDEEEDSETEEDYQEEDKTIVETTEQHKENDKQKHVEVVKDKFVPKPHSVTLPKEIPGYNDDDEDNDEDEDDDDDNDQEILIERGHIYYSGYGFLLPSAILVGSLVILLLSIGVVVCALVRRKRGERYRMALLASHKNSIVYQKLTEEIQPREKQPKQPGIHRYAPIQSV